MRPTCISLQISDKSSQEILRLCEGLPIQTPPEFNCFYHTSILQFYTGLDLLVIKQILTDIDYSQPFGIILDYIREWDNSLKKVSNMSLSYYDAERYALMINYDINYVLLGFSQKLCSLLRNFIIASGFDSLVTVTSDNTSFTKDSRFHYVYNFPSKVQSGIFNPHTTAGFVRNSDFALVNRAVNSLFSTREANLYHTKVVLSDLSDLCMTPFFNTLEVWKI